MTTRTPAGAPLSSTGSSPGSSPAGSTASNPSTSTSTSTHHNAVVLRGRLSAEAEPRELPSGDVVVTLRLVVDRPPDPAQERRRVDVIDVACWSARTRRSALALRADELVEVTGSLRRRFYAAAGARASRYEVEATRVARVGRRAGRAAGVRPAADAP